MSSTVPIWETRRTVLSILFESSVPERLGAIDTLRPDQTSAVAEYVAAQQAEAPQVPRD